MARQKGTNINSREFFTGAGVWKAKDPRSGLSDWLANFSCYYISVNTLRIHP
jgi:hypothetical protein